MSASWSRLSIRLVPIHVTALASPVALLFASLLVTGGVLTLQVLIIAAILFMALIVISGIGLMRFLTTRYRIGPDPSDPELIEVRSGIVFRSRRSLPIEGVRSIDATANLLYRAFGLTSLRIDTGEQGSAAGKILILDGIRAIDAAALQQTIIQTRDSSPTRTSIEGDGQIAGLEWSWIRYAPLTIWGVGGVFVAAGAAMRVLGEMKINPLELGAVVELQHRFGSAPAWFGILIVVLVIVVLGILGSTAAFVENWWNYRLERADDGDLRLRRGLIVTRSISIEARRMSGVEITEPLLLRLARGARIDAIASGLGNREDNRRRRRLCPPMPRRNALRIAAALMGDIHSPTSATLTSHPVAALYRRIRWGLIVPALPGLVFTTVAPVVTPAAVPLVWLCSIAALFAGALAGWGSYRSLGHAVNERYLVTRAGIFPRRTAALATADIIGWRISCSPAQRRRGLVTLAATTAGGESIQKIRDVAAIDAVAIAEAAAPGLLAPFALEATLSSRR